MWYTQTHESTHFYPRPDGRRTAPNPSGITFVRCLYSAPLPDLASQRPRRAGPRDCEASGLRRPDGSQRDQRLQCLWSGRAARRLFAPPSTAYQLFRGGAPAVERPVASQSPRFWQRAQYLDLGTRRPGQLRAGDHPGVGLRRKRASRTQTPENQLEARQTLDYQPRSPIPAKKNARDQLIVWASQQADWATGFLDEVWWSRFALPRMHAWQDEEQPVHLVEQSWKKGDPDPKALACYGVLWQTGSPDDPVREEMWLRFVTGRPVSDITTQFLDWCCEHLVAQGKKAWLLIWDNASWHISKIVRTWIREHNQQVKLTGKGVRILPFRLPTQSPWLNPIEPKWVHGKRAVVEPTGLLSASQLAERVCSHFGCSYESHLVIPEKVS